MTPVCVFSLLMEKKEKDRQGEERRMRKADDKERGNISQCGGGEERGMDS